MSLFKASEETDTITPEGVGTVEDSFSTDISADDELDFTDDGIPGHRVIAKVTSTDRTEREGDEGKTNVMLKIGFSILNSSHVSPGMNITSTFWSRHTNPEAQRIGRGQFKTLIKAALSKTAIGAVEELAGAYVTAWAKDKDGFPVLGNWKSVDQDELNEALTSAGVGELT